MKLNLGSGQNYIKDYINIDLYVGQDKIDASDILTHHPDWEGKVDEILGMHIFEHFKRHEAIRALEQYYKLLSPTGKLILEMPNAKFVAFNYYQNPNDIMSANYLWGNQEGDGQVHYWGWCPTTLSVELDRIGYEYSFMEATDYHKNEMPCFRVEASK